MPVAIRTTYRGPTNTRGSRIVASSQAGRTVTPYDHALNSDENHAAAARAHLDTRFPLATRLEGTVTRQLVSGSLPDAHVHVIVYG